MPKKIILLLSLMLSAAGYGLAQTDCPFGLTDDPAPGQCGRYVDRNGDNICDLSQDLSQSGGASEGEEAASTQNENPSPAESDQSVVEPETPDVPEAAPQHQPEDISAAQPIEEYPERPQRPNYHPWLLLLMVSVLAIAGEIWQRRDSTKIVLIQTAWNWMLLISFLACSLTGLYFILPPGSRPAITFNLSYWHSVTGLIFIYIGLYHAIRRAACLIRGAKTCVKKTPCC